MAGGAGAVLDPLRFVEHDQVESQLQVCHQFTVALHQLVVGDLDGRLALLPLPAAPRLVAFDDGHGHFGGPGGEFALPDHEEVRRSDQVGIAADIRSVLVAGFCPVEGRHAQACSDLEACCTSFQSRRVA